MEILIDQWTPFFEELESRVNHDGRRRLLHQLIGDVYDVTVLNFGPDGLARPEEWESLTQRYARERHGGDQTPTLILTGELKAGFVVELSDSSATLTNTIDYADLHQFGNSYAKLPARPFYPIDENGNLTPYMEARLYAIVEEHFQI